MEKRAKISSMSWELIENQSFCPNYNRFLKNLQQYIIEQPALGIAIYTTCYSLFEKYVFLHSLLKVK